MVRPLLMMIDAEYHDMIIMVIFIIITIIITILRYVHSKILGAFKGIDSSDWEDDAQQHSQCAIYFELMRSFPNGHKLVTDILGISYISRSMMMMMMMMMVVVVVMMMMRLMVSDDDDDENAGW